jgi:hypothetical protein
MQWRCDQTIGNNGRGCNMFTSMQTAADRGTCQVFTVSSYGSTESSPNPYGQRKF